MRNILPELNIDCCSVHILPTFPSDGKATSLPRHLSVRKSGEEEEHHSLLRQDLGGVTEEEEEEEEEEEKEKGSWETVEIRKKTFLSFLLPPLENSPSLNSGLSCVEVE